MLIDNEIRVHLKYKCTENHSYEDKPLKAERAHHHCFKHQMTIAYASLQ